MKGNNKRSQDAKNQFRVRMTISTAITASYHCREVLRIVADLLDRSQVQWLLKKFSWVIPSESWFFECLERFFPCFLGKCRWSFSTQLFTIGSRTLTPWKLWALLLYWRLFVQLIMTWARKIGNLERKSPNWKTFWESRICQWSVCLANDCRNSFFRDDHIPCRRSFCWTYSIHWEWIVIPRDISETIFRFVRS